MNRMPWMKTATALVGATMLLAACGGSDSSSPPPPIGDGLTQEQRDDRAASASVTGLFAFAVALMRGRTSETDEPRTIDGIAPPVADDAEPMTLPL